MTPDHRTVLRLDMDAFYAAIEQRDRPELRGRPVIVGADPQGGRGRGGVSTPSYQARRLGAPSPPPLPQGARRGGSWRCPAASPTSWSRSRSTRPFST